MAHPASFTHTASQGAIRPHAGCAPTEPTNELLQLYLKVLKATGEVQDVPKVSLGVPTGTRRLSLLQLLGNRIELQGPDGKDLTGPQELFSCNSRAPRVSIHLQPCPSLAARAFAHLANS